MFRPNKDEYYLGIARAVAKGSTCLRRQYGAVIVKDDRIVSTGFNGSAKGEPSCCDNGECWRETHDIPHGDQYEKCKAIHAEINAVINAAPAGVSTVGATLYLAGFENSKALRNVAPCELCSRVIKNAGITKVVTHWKEEPKEARSYPFGTTVLQPVDEIKE